MSSATATDELTLAHVQALYERPLLDLVFEAAQTHRQFHDPATVQCSQLMSIKTGGCPEDCGYCSQSAHNESDVDRQPLSQLDEVLAEAKQAKERGADRFCMGAAWREVKPGADFDRVLDMVRGVHALGLESCVTLGMLEEGQARQLKDAGLDYYNHNLDTGKSHYDKIISTRSYEDRLNTISNVRSAGISVCCGGILGMGEDQKVRAELLFELASLNPPPESVPINALVPVEGTPLSEVEPIEWTEMVRAVAVARILMPHSRVRLSAGRTELSEEAQAMCFLAGANSIFVGSELLTTPNPEPKSDAALFEKLGLTAEQNARR